MRSNRRVTYRTDIQILAHDTDVLLLQAIAGGQILRGRDGQETTSMFSEYYLTTHLSRFDLQRLQRDDLISLPISGSPILQPRGQRIVAVSRGEIARPLE